MNKSDATNSPADLTTNSCQLAPSSDWSIVLYEKTTGQVVLYNRRENQFRIEQDHHQRDLVPATSHADAALVATSSARSLMAIKADASTKALAPGRNGGLRRIPPLADADDVADGQEAAWYSRRDLGSNPQYKRGSSHFKHLSYLLKQKRAPQTLEYVSDDRIRPKSPSTLPSRATSFESVDKARVLSEDETLAAATALNGDESFDNSLSSNALNQGYYERFFIEKHKLGRGLRGSVFLCQHVLDNVYLGEYAIKKVAVGNNRAWLERMLREVTLLETLRHPNIIEYKHSWLEVNSLTKFGKQFDLSSECANGGNLEEYMQEAHDDVASQFLTDAERKKRRKAELRHRLNQGASAAPAGETRPPARYLSVDEIWEFISDICSGLSHLHSHGIIHRDLKPQNLLVHYPETNENGAHHGRPRLLLTDFGECEVLSRLERRDRTGATGTLEFMAPELLKGKGFGSAMPLLTANYGRKHMG
ncbi:putative serine/threonine-protein kinase iks1 [Spiromyces aspiralis]|uniref:Serine/threonine-protein kinase iks1 n=1 Tax=Spiromyces aspiralis TaxID=68401 RepID=A0ACC1I093_9FUNG|nr:putative serine/threonine-protein kinase iks1 [Spiromyces aspiralis]